MSTALRGARRIYINQDSEEWAIMQFGKQQLRSEVLRKRSTQKRAVNNGAKKITENLKGSSIFGDKQVVHVYLPIEGKNEIDTWPIVQWLLKTGHEVWASYLPEDEAQDGFCQISTKTTYGKDRFGAPLPLEAIQKDISPTVILVPCLAADKQGNRLGYGSGWYDAFLTEHPNALTIALVYEQFLLDETPHEPHDVRLKILVTEQGITAV